MKAKRLDAEACRQLIHYDAESGTLTWRERPRSMFKTERDWKAWNTRYAGQVAFTAQDGSGYLAGTILGVRILAHRLIWFLVTGEWPDQVDHRDHNRSNNRLTNLRASDPLRNQRNRTRQKSNKSGINGVFQLPSGKWTAQIKVKRKPIHLGVFDTKTHAAAARMEANARHGFAENHGRAA